MKFTLAVRHHDDSMRSLTVDLFPSAPLRHVFATVAKGLGCHPLSLSFRTWAGGAWTNVPHPPSQETDEVYDSFERVHLHKPVPEKRMAVELRRVLMEQHWAHQVAKTHLPFLEGDLHSMTRLFGEPFVVRVLDPIVERIPRDITSRESACQIKTVHQAIQYVFGDMMHTRHESWCEESVYADERLQKLPQRFQQHRDVVLATIGMGNSAVGLFWSDLGDANRRAYVHDKECVLHMITAGVCASHVDSIMDPAYWNDRDVVMCMLRHVGLNSRHEDKFLYPKLSASLQTDPDVIRACLKRFPKELMHVPEHLRTASDVAEAVRRDPWMIKYAHPQTFELACLALQQCGDVLRDIDEGLKQDPRLVEMAIEQSGNSIEYAPAFYRDNFRTAIKAINHSGGRAYKFMSERLREDEIVFTLAAQKCPDTLRDAPEHFRLDFRRVLAACVAPYGRPWVAAEDNALRYAPYDLQSDERLVMESVKIHPLSLKYAGGDLWSNLSIIKAAMKGDPFAYEFASRELRETNKELAVLFAETCDVEKGCGRRILGQWGLLEKWSHDRDVVHALIRRARTAESVRDIFGDMSPDLKHCRDTLAWIIEKDMLTPHDSMGGVIDGLLRKRYSTELVFRWEHDSSVVLALIDKHEHNPKCEMTNLLRFACVLEDHATLQRVIPRCNFRGASLCAEAYQVLRDEHTGVTSLGLLKCHSYLKFTEEEAEDLVYPDDWESGYSDFFEPKRAPKRRRVQ